ncbi:glycosyltransferase [Martelella alba]|uniref:Glycosyltransferase n=1 Tax=Martelella alba TaxID=2590451 RepID=A0ABY2SLP2_9HYPH|nr:glycosyltransferase [Martelella alba]TKI05777.1 glycosyltransferase [Martelella alba]
MKIIFFISRFPIFSETFVLNQIVSFIKLGHNVRIISIWPGDTDKKHPLYDDYNLGEITSYLLPAEKNNKIFKLVYRLFKTVTNIYKKNVRNGLNKKKFGSQTKKLFLSTILARNKKSSADFFLVHFGINGIIARQLRRAGLFEGKIATIFHGNEISEYSLINKHKADYEKLFSDTELILPISYNWRNKLISLGCAIQKIIVLRMGIDLESFNFNEMIVKKINEDSPIKLLTVARFVEKKGIYYAICACKKLKEQNFKFHYKIVGSGPLLASLKEKIYSLELQNNIEIVGFKNQTEVKELMNESNFLLLPSITAMNGDQEGIPVVLMEAMAMGLPVISTYHSGIPELIENEKSGFLVPEKEASAISHILIDHAYDKKTLREITKLARIKIEEEFDQQKVNTYLANLLESKIGE